MTYRSLVMHPSPKLVAPQPHGKHRTHPSTLSSTAPTRPWRDHNQ
jgi:hypothetical protein